MANAAKAGLHEPEEEGDTVRLTISLPRTLHAEVQSIAKRDDRSLAFVVRKAVEQLVRDEQPLLYQKSP